MGALQDLEQLAKGWDSACPQCKTTISRTHPMDNKTCNSCGWDASTPMPERRKAPRENPSSKNVW